MSRFLWFTVYSTFLPEETYQNFQSVSRSENACFSSNTQVRKVVIAVHLAAEWVITPHKPPHPSSDVVSCRPWFCRVARRASVCCAASLYCLPQSVNQSVTLEMLKW